LRRSAPSRAAKITARAALVLIGLSPLFLAALPECALSRGLDAWFSFQCRQDPERALRLWGAPTPVCARCLGLYLGLAVGAIAGLPRLPLRGFATWVGLAAAALLAHALLARGTALDAAPIRLAAGIALAYPIGAFAAILCHPRRGRDTLPG
jgi:hypothetical protein